MRGSLAYLFCVLQLGCSFMVVTGPPDPLPAKRPIDCTAEKGGPWMDAVLAGMFITLGAVLGYAISQD